MKVGGNVTLTNVSIMDRFVMVNQNVMMVMMRNLQCVLGGTAVLGDGNARII